MRASFMTPARMGESKSRFIASPRNPQQSANEAELRALFGVTGHRWPKDGCPARCIQGIWVQVLPDNHVSLRDLHGAKKKRAQHRCLATCPECGAQVSAGRLAQHRCDARVDKAERLRRFEFRKALTWTRTQAELRALALAYWDAPFDTQDEDDAFNAFGEAAMRAMSPEQQTEWHEWCLKATGDEIVNEALRILGMKQLERNRDAGAELDHGGACPN